MTGRSNRYARNADLPDVQRARVDAFRQRVESGAYQIDADRVAIRLLALERDLGRRRLKRC